MKKLLTLIAILVCSVSWGAGTTKIETGAVLAEAYQGANFNLDTASATRIVYNTVLQNPGGNYNGTTGEFTVPVSGRYYIEAQACLQTSASGGFTMITVFQGASAISRKVEAIRSDSSNFVKTSGDFYLVAGIVVRVELIQYSGGTLISYGNAGRDISRLIIRLLP